MVRQAHEIAALPDTKAAIKILLARRADPVLASPSTCVGFCQDLLDFRPWRFPCDGTAIVSSGGSSSSTS
jgi:hypothetical protein